MDRKGRKDLDDNSLLEAFGTTEAVCEAETPGKLYPEILADVHRRLADKWGIKAGDSEATESALADLERSLGTKKAEILRTAQSIFHDVVPARTVGLATMWINRRKTVGGWGATPAPQAKGALSTPDMEVGSMADLVVLHQAHLRGDSA